MYLVFSNASPVIARTVRSCFWISQPCFREVAETTFQGGHVLFPSHLCLLHPREDLKASNRMKQRQVPFDALPLLIYTHGDDERSKHGRVRNRTSKADLLFGMEGLFRAGTEVQIIGLHKHIHFQLLSVCVCVETLVSELSYTHVPVPVLPSASLGGTH